MHDPEVARAGSYPYPPTSSVLVHDPGNDADLHIRHPGSHPGPPSVTVSDADKEDAVGVELREVMRTPSPTPTETRVLLQKSRTCDWKALYARIRHPRPYLTTRNICASSCSSSVALELTELVYPTRSDLRGHFRGHRAHYRLARAPEEYSACVAPARGLAARVSRHQYLPSSRSPLIAASLAAHLGPGPFCSRS